MAAHRDDERQRSKAEAQIPFPLGNPPFVSNMKEKGDLPVTFPGDPGNSRVGLTEWARFFSVKRSQATLPAELTGT